ncbi:hypothetical protein J5N97_022947 [Dioscorea zingiberensis]|uniref:Calcium uniporter protein C-terminal domain-containing protein n=1 Tax=Dioscorea zingiberensis TaxID=325984 RepID=A0A9D5CC92_9LILI|nr:hypothetical protein J5N97_022947 [Dioscorea zingiberensis]
MALRETIAKIRSQIRAIQTTSPARAAAVAAIRRRIFPQPLQRRPIFDAVGFPTGDRLMELIRGLNRDRIRLDGLLPLPPLPPPTREQVRKRLSVEDVKKVLRASQMAAVRARLRAIPMRSVSYKEFLDVCCEVSGPKQGMGIARALDDSGDVIVFGDLVFLSPDQVVKAVERVISFATAMEEEELREMEEKKAEIDRVAEGRVRRELWCGLGFVMAQTLWFMRLTFWELSWDVMEPICFFFTSMNVMAGYAFFLRTSRDPSFEGYYTARFAVKQRRLMRDRGFDLQRFNELRACVSGEYSCRPRPKTSGFDVVEGSEDDS